MLVTADESLAEGLRYPKERVRNLGEILAPAADEPVGCGVDVSEVFRHLYQREFQFVRRHPTQILVPVAADARLALFVAVCFGVFPGAAGLAYLKHNYIEGLGAQVVSVNQTNFWSCFLPDRGFPLRLGSADLEVRSQQWGAALFFMDATSWLDSLDFWNLRALGWNVLPLPKQWANALVEGASEFIAQNYVPYRYNKQLYQSTTVVCSRSCSFKDLQQFAASLKRPGEHALSLQRWYPRLWDEWARDKDRATRCDVLSKEVRSDVPVSDGRVRIGSLKPDFVCEPGDRGLQWATVTELRDYSRDLDAVEVVPPGLTGLDRALGVFRLNGIWATREGIVSIGTAFETDRHWRLLAPLQVMRNWMKSRGFDLEVSGAGKVARQLIRALGGLHGIGPMAHEKVLRLLNDMAHQRAAQGDPESAEHGESRGKVRGKVVSRKQWVSLFKQINNDAARGSRSLEWLVAHDVLRVGLYLQCPECSQHTFYDLQAIAESLTCERCLSFFPFPAATPPVDGWHYRAIGPFAVENFAQGAYCTALALRFFGSLMGDAVTCVPSVELKGSDTVVEADFALFLRQHQLAPGNPLFVVGECKTFGVFGRKDLRNISTLGESFPGAVLAFCTLRAELTPAERRGIARLAERGRRLLRHDQWHNPVMVLTAIELLSQHDPPYCWERAGDPYRTLGASYGGFEGIQALCNVTQQMHLGMASYWDRFEENRDKRPARGVGTHWTRVSPARSTS